MEHKVALITGGNAGIGLALAIRLVEWNPTVHICLACRNPKRAEEAEARILLACPGASITLLLVDVSNLSSVYMAAKEIRSRYKHIDYLYLNAGIMPVSSVDWGNFFNGLFSWKCVDMFRTGDGLLKQVDGTTSEGLQQIFATNLFGHFVLIKELEDQLGGDKSTQIIWTSSSNAKKEAFHLDDVQHKLGHEPYSSSKHASDLISTALNERLNSKNVYSHATCPGLVMTNLTFGILPSWFWMLVMPILWLLRLFTPSMNVSPENGSEALFWLAKQRPETLDPLSKYHSRVSFFGTRYTAAVKMPVDLDMAKKTYSSLNDLEKTLRPKYKS